MNTLLGYGVGRIEVERVRQVREEDWDAEHDDGHVCGELARAAACYAAPTELFEGPLGEHSAPAWPWAPVWDKRLPRPSGSDGDDYVTWVHLVRPATVARIETRQHELAKAGALIAAEIERLERAKREIQG